MTMNGIRVIFLLALCTSQTMIASSFPLHSPSQWAAHSSPHRTTTTTTTTTRSRKTTTTTTTRLGYEPQWKKKTTLSDELAQSGNPKDFAQIGLKGSIPVVFRQGDDVKSTMALPGQPLRDVASQAGQFIKYGCGKGQCGTCEALVNGQWIRPCISFVPGDLAPNESFVVQVKQVKSVAKSSGKFFSVRSFFMGFYNNFLGIVGFVKYRKQAKQNWSERQEYEDLIRQKTLEKKLARMKQDATSSKDKSNSKLSA
jgi:2Fe-2S iron-sulfur cluster binding domain